MPKSKSINLLPQEEFAASTTGRVLKWATGTFRIIVIATETVVMAAFLSRFWLDTQNSNLNKSIKAKSAQITAQADLEKQFRSVQSKLNIYEKIGSSQKNSDVIDRITSRVPQSITLSRIAIENDGIDIRGSSASDSDIGQFVYSLQGSPFKSVDLKQVNSSDNLLGGTSFIIEIKY